MEDKKVQLELMDWLFETAVGAYLDPDRFKEMPEAQETAIDVLTKDFKERAEAFTQGDASTILKLKLRYLPLMFYGGTEPAAVRYIARKCGYGLEVDDIRVINFLLSEGLLDYSTEDIMHRVQAEIVNITLEAVYGDTIKDDYSDRWLDYKLEPLNKDTKFWFYNPKEN